MTDSRNKEIPNPTILEAHSATGEFRWEDLDHSLVGLKCTELVEEVHDRIKADESRIRFENRGNLNGNAVPSLILKMKEHNLKEHATRVYEIYCAVWQTQGFLKSAAFIRTVWARGILTVLRARTGAIAGELARVARATNLPSEVANAQLAAFRRRMQRLEDRWARRLEAEAKEFGHAERRTKATVATQSPQLLNPQHSDIPPKVQASLEDSSRAAIVRMIKNPQAHPFLLTPQVADYFGVKLRTIYRWVFEGHLKRGGRRGSITTESIVRWEKKRSRNRPLD